MRIPATPPSAQPPFSPSPGPAQAAGVVPVLFASQWLLTCYSCPFPVGFACRLVDVMLQARSLLSLGAAAGSRCVWSCASTTCSQCLLGHRAPTHTFPMFAWRHRLRPN